MKKFLKNIGIFILIGGASCTIAYGLVYIISFRPAHDISIENRKLLSNQQDVERFQKFGEL